MTAEDEKQPRKTREPINDLPLYPSEAQIARAVLGSRAKDWPRIAKCLEDKEGLPRINELMGGRFWPAVVAFFHGWQCVPLGGGIPENTPPSRFRIVPPNRAAQPSIINDPANVRSYYRAGKVRVRSPDGLSSWIEDAKPTDPPGWQKKHI
jgi:hypothetical protein